MKYNIINGSAESPQTKDLRPIEGEKHATNGVKIRNYGGKNTQLKGQKEATILNEGVKMGNYQQGVLPQEWLYNPVVYSQVSGDF